ncbi:hypothetical protein L226DRAFT_44398 [Lentinus tigrinus ALCF2SS1-7]|uniref:uncharacterized protein n=1 Tax=Lentinus tigrinus ALCF2SS1-7 TaxID=1328758 RepID=UPI0011662E19|nr:hypothetical protein L226DRAFT_44398 [Lentinus tigrinus ALCF2SS1-7]
MDVTSVPNPFYKTRLGEYQDAEEGRWMTRMTPLFPLLVKKREMDKVVVLDSSGETSDFKPNGQSFLATKQKVSMLPRGFMNFSSPFPNSTDEFVSLGLNTRPVFFGCADADDAEDQYPLLVYIPNDDPGNVTNIVIYTLQLPVVNQTRIFDRSYLLASRGRVVNPPTMISATSTNSGARALRVRPWSARGHDKESGGQLHANNASRGTASLKIRARQMTLDGEWWFPPRSWPWSLAVWVAGSGL